MSYREVDRFLRRHGFSVARQVGSHARYLHGDGRATVVPRHARELDPWLVAKILKDAGIDPDELRRKA